MLVNLTKEQIEFIMDSLYFYESEGFCDMEDIKEIELLLGDKY